MTLQFSTLEMNQAALAAALAADDIPDGVFPDLPPRDDLQNTLYLNLPGYLAALAAHFGGADTTAIFSEVPLGWRTNQRAGLLVPDLMVAFGIDRAAAVTENGYSIDKRGKPPDFVLEIASVHTALNDETRKRVGYAAYGVPEYWRFDPTGGERYQTGLAADALTPNGDYQPIPIHQTDADRYWGHSNTLNLDVCWEYGQLRWYDPAARRYLLTHQEEYEGRRAAEYRADLERAGRINAEAEVGMEQAGRANAEAELGMARAGQANAEAELGMERTARAEAELQADLEQTARAAAETRIRELEAEIERLRNQ